MVVRFLVSVSFFILRKNLRDMSKSNAQFYFNVIKGNRLLCSDNAKLAGLLGRKSVSNCARRDGNKGANADELLQRDYQILERTAEKLTDGGVSTGNGFSLSDLVDCYVDRSKAYKEEKPNLRNCSPGLISSGTADEERTDILADIISCSITGMANKKSLYILNFLTLNPEDISTYVNNYSAAIGMLLLMGCIKPGNDKSRVREITEGQLNNEYLKAFTLISKLYQKSSNPGSPLTFSWYDEYKSMTSPINRCRLTLIFWFKCALDEYVIRVRPDALEEYSTPFHERMFAFPKESILFYDASEDNKEHFYKIEKAVIQYKGDVSSTQKYYLYDCHYEIRNSRPHIRNERYEVDFFKTGLASVTSARFAYTFITNAGPISQHESIYSFKYDEKNGTLSLKEERANPDTRIRLPLRMVEISDIETKKRFARADIMDNPTDYEYMLGVGVVPVARLVMITAKNVIMLDGECGYVINANKENHLKELLPHLTITDKICIYKVCINGNERLFLYIEKGGRYSFEITDEESKKKYGVTPHAPFH